VVHRDLKPGNVMLTKSGAKLMDFGLAREVGRDGRDSEVTHTELGQDPSPEGSITKKGMVVGTFQYMAPEQLEGKRADARSDIWALGCVLYEMATGRRAFEGFTPVSVISAIMRDEPRKMTALAPLTPASLERVVRQCLTKDPDERIQTAHDLKLQIRWIDEVQQEIDPQRHGSRRLVLTSALAIALLIALGLTIYSAPRRQNHESVVFQLPAPPGAAEVGSPRISPDGRVIAFNASDSIGVSHIWIRPLNSGAALCIPGSEGAARPFWSPDSRDLAFFADSRLKTVAIESGAFRTVCADPKGSDGTWGRDAILYDGPASIQEVNPAGGTPTSASVTGQAGEATSSWPSFLPDGRQFLYVGDYGASKPRVLLLSRIGSKEHKMLATGLLSRAEFAKPGFVLYARDRSLVAQQLDSQKRTLIGEPITLVDPVVTDGDNADFSVSLNGTLAYRSAPGANLIRLVWVDRTGKELGTICDPADYRVMSLSPDGKRLAIWRDLDIWMIDLVRNLATRVTFDRSNNGSPVWSPDGSRIVFHSNRTGKLSLYQCTTKGSEGETLFMSSGRPLNPSDYSMDGKYIAVLTPEGGSQSIWVLSMTGDRKLNPLVQTPFVLRDARFSPDARWIAYSSPESGQREVYVQAFPGPGEKMRVSTDGGRDPQWRRDGREMFYISREGKMMAVSLAPTASLTLGIPHTLFETTIPFDGQVGRTYAVTPDGQRFIVRKFVEGTAKQPTTVVLNWYEHFIAKR
jgi:Tol biopolymer transport system component